MKKIIKGKTYNTDTSYELRKKRKSTMIVPDIELKEINILYETRTGNYFFFNIENFIDHKHPLMNDYRENIIPVSKSEAKKFLYGEGGK